MYTDDEDFEQEEYNKKNVNSKRKSFDLKKLIIILLIIVAIGVAVFFVIKYIAKKNENYKVEISPNEISIQMGSTIDISAKVFDNDNKEVPNAEIKWQSSNNDIATVENNTIKGVNYGKVKLTAKYISKMKNEFTDSKDVYVYSGDYNTVLNNISINDGDLYLPIGANQFINIMPDPSDGRIDNVSFSSGDSNIASVDSNGNITGIGEGETTIVIDVNNGSFQKVLKVIVTNSVSSPTYKVVPQSIAIEKNITTMKVGEAKTLSYTITPNNADNDFTWISSNSEIISVDSNGVVKGLREGKAQITIYSNSYSEITDSIDIEVERAPIEDEKINTTLPNTNEVVDPNALYVNMTLKVGQSYVISSNFYQSSDLSKQFDYYVNNKAIANIEKSLNGISATISGLSVGKTTVIVRVNDAITKIINVNVTNATTITQDECASSTRVNCPSGEYSLCGKCEICPVGSFCNNGGKISRPAGTESAAGAKSYNECTKCKIGTYSTGNAKACVACPEGKTTLSTGAKSDKECVVTSSSGSTTTSIKCEPGEYLVNGKCIVCPVGSFCPNGIIKSTCPSGKGSKLGAKSYSEC